MKAFSPFLLLLLLSCEPENSSTQILESQKWVSKDKFRSEVWFQDWSAYTRLFIKIYRDTLEVSPSPYVTETKNKPYLYPKPYLAYEVEQMIGNLVWDKQVSWENSHINSFSWEVDRSNPKKLLPINYKGTAAIVNGKLNLIVTDNDSLVLDILLDPQSY